VIPLLCRIKGGAPQLGARLPGELGPFGVRPDEDDGQGDEELLDDGQADEEQHDDQDEQ